MTDDLRAEEAERDAKRIDKLEQCIRDGSYASILNDIVATCQHAYATLGPGPALRTAIDAALPYEEKLKEERL